MAENGIIHRDIKPANIMMNSNYSIKICDPGVSIILYDLLKKKLEKIKEAGWKNTKPYTSKCNYAGSPDYIAPEIKEGIYSLEGKSDVYSFAIVIIELLFGRN